MQQAERLGLFLHLGSQQRVGASPNGPLNTPLHICFLGPHKFVPPRNLHIDRSIRSAGLAIVRQTDRHTDHATPPVTIARICTVYRRYADYNRPTYWRQDIKISLVAPGPDLRVWRPWAGSLLEAPTHPQMV